tara:strand:- start:8078 stop:8791 length:714 start_codon:yes stop_codon:yes gene_type:complete
MDSILPKILIAAPQSDVKDYCFEQWLLNVRQLDYPKDRIEILLVDNSDTDKYSEYMRSQGIKVIREEKKGRGIIETLASCHQVCADYALDNGFDFLLHLETDVFPPPHSLLDMVNVGEPVVGSLYHIYDGSYRQLSLQIEPKFPLKGYLKAYSVISGCGEHLKDKLLQVMSGALGCTLIHSEVLKTIKFRSVDGQDHHPDTWFSVDLKINGIPFYVHTEVFCEHRNKDWGTYGINYK